MQIDQYRTEPTDPTQRAAWMRMIEREAYRYHEERETQRKTEDHVLARAINISPKDTAPWANYLRECAAQIRDHRQYGNYTTIHR